MLRIGACLKFRWYDFWVGWYWDRKREVLYICLLPMVVLEVWWWKWGR